MALAGHAVPGGVTVLCSALVSPELTMLTGKLFLLQQVVTGTLIWLSNRLADHRLAVSTVNRVLRRVPFLLKQKLESRLAKRLSCGPDRVVSPFELSSLRVDNAETNVKGAEAA